MRRWNILVTFDYELDKTDQNKNKQNRIGKN